MRYFLLILGMAILATVGLLGLRGDKSRRQPLYIFPDMKWQAKLRPQKADNAFTNGLTSQLPVAGTVPRSVALATPGGDVFPFEDSPVNTGRVKGTTNFVENIPVAVNAEMILRGQKQFQINCTPCHGALGDGNGITKKIGAMGVVANLHDKRIVLLPDGELFHVISNGRTLMSGYAANISIQDRWAIVAYLRALQLTKLGSVDDVPQELRASLKK